MKLQKRRSSFPEQLYCILNDAEKNRYQGIVSWMPHGRSFRIHNPGEFIETIIPTTNLHQIKWASFQRQLLIYKFTRISKGDDKGAYYHKSFIRGQASLMNRIQRYTDPMKLQKRRSSFPEQLYSILNDAEKNQYQGIVSWMPHGRSFRIHNPGEFIETIIPTTNLHQIKWTSFQRQLYIYEFTRISKGDDRGAYYHKSFIRGQASLMNRIQMVKINGKKCRKPAEPNTEPNFYVMKDCPQQIVALHEAVSRNNGTNCSIKNEEKTQESQESCIAHIPITFLKTIVADGTTVTSSSTKPRLKTLHNTNSAERKAFYGQQKMSRIQRNKEHGKADESLIALVTGDFLHMSDDMTELKLMFATVGLPESLDDLPEDEDEWKCLLETI